MNLWQYATGIFLNCVSVLCTLYAVCCYSCLATYLTLCNCVYLAALEYLLNNPGDLDRRAFEVAAGVGVEVSPEQIETEVGIYLEHGALHALHGLR